MVDFVTKFWKPIAGVIGAIGVLWGFRKTLKEIRTSISVALNKPFDEMNEKVDKLSTELNGKIDALDEKIMKAEDSDKKVRNALLTMQRSSLLSSCEDFIKRGFATVNEKETISSQYDSYHELGGDQFITGLVDDVMDLPLEKQTAKNTNK